MEFPLKLCKNVKIADKNKIIPFQILINLLKLCKCSWKSGSLKKLGKSLKYTYSPKTTRIPLILWKYSQFHTMSTLQEGNCDKIARERKKEVLISNFHDRN